MPSNPPPAESALPAPTSPSLSRRALGVFHRHYFRLSFWRRALLFVALVMVVTGFVGAVGSVVREKPPEQKTAAVTIEQLQVQAAHSSLTADQQVQLDQAKQKVSDVGHWFYDKTAPNLWRWGLSFAVMFIVGYAFRQFIKTMASLASIVLVGAGVASYFGYINLSDVKTDLTHGTGWAMDQATAVKEMIVKFIGASLVGTAGFVVGFLRR